MFQRPKFQRAQPLWRALAEIGVSIIGGGDGPVVETPLSRVLQTIVTSREANRAELDTILSAGEARSTTEAPGPSWTDEENTRMAEITEQMRTQDGRIAELAEQEARDRQTGQALVQLGDAGEIVSVRREPLQYERYNRSTSYFRDLGLAMVGNDQSAWSRLRSHQVQMDVEIPRREAQLRASFERAMSASEFRGYEMERRDITRVDGAGGEFVPPIWLMELYADLPRAGRPFADRCRGIPLPGGTDSISVPKITGGTTVAAQTADNAAVSETDATTGSATAHVNTYAGQQDVALQLLEQSPLVFDEIIFQDLRDDYDAKIDVASLNGTGANGQHQGVLVVASTNAVTYTDASPTVPELYPKAANAVALVATNRKLPPSLITMSPLRWFWHVAALDGSNRPFVVPTGQGPMNALASMGDPQAEGPVGTMLGLPVMIDANMPATLGGGTEDAIIAARMQDLILFEGALRTRALAEVLSGTLTVRLQLYAYSAFMPDRQVKAIGKITGTGLAAPTF